MAPTDTLGGKEDTELLFEVTASLWTGHVSLNRGEKKNTCYRSGVFDLLAGGEHHRRGAMGVYPSHA
jgi:hypothetical protein